MVLVTLYSSSTCWIKPMVKSYIVSQVSQNRRLISASQGLYPLTINPGGKIHPPFIDYHWFSHLETFVDWSEKSVMSHDFSHEFWPWPWRALRPSWASALRPWAWRPLRELCIWDPHGSAGSGLRRWHQPFLNGYPLVMTNSSPWKIPTRNGGF